MRVPDTNGVVRGPAAGKQEGEGGGGRVPARPGRRKSRRVNNRNINKRRRATSINAPF